MGKIARLGTLYELLASKIPRQSAHPRRGRRSPQNRLSKISTLKSALQYIRHLKSAPARESHGCISSVASARHIEQLRFIVTDMPPKHRSKRKCAESHSDCQIRATATAVSSNTGVDNSSDSAVPLTRNDIPAIVQVAR